MAKPPFLQAVHETPFNVLYFLFCGFILGFIYLILNFLWNMLNHKYHLTGRKHNVAVVKELYIYPVKSCAGIKVDSMKIDESGPLHDREYMIVTESGDFISQRQKPKMSLIRPTLFKGDLILSAPNKKDLIIKPITLHPTIIDVRVWDCYCKGIDQGEEAAKWLSDFLQVKCKLVKMPSDFIRPVPSSDLKGLNFQTKYNIIKSRVKYADDAPLLLISTASLDELNSRLNHPVPANRFRPNIVVEGCKAFEEDKWKCIDINTSITFTVAVDCTRCKIPTVNQDTGEMAKDGEPIKTLETFRKKGKSLEVSFGRYILPENLGEISVGDQVNTLGLLSAVWVNLKRYKILFYKLKKKWWK